MNVPIQTSEGCLPHYGNSLGLTERKTAGTRYKMLFGRCAKESSGLWSPVLEKVVPAGTQAWLSLLCGWMPEMGSTWCRVWTAVETGQLCLQQAGPWNILGRLSSSPEPGLSPLSPEALASPRLQGDHPPCTPAPCGMPTEEEGCVGVMGSNPIFFSWRRSEFLGPIAY